MPNLNWTTGWNMPGYLPEMEPLVCDSREEALEWLISEIELWAESAYGVNCETTPEVEAYEDLAASVAHDNRPGATHPVIHVSTEINLVVWARPAYPDEVAE